MLLVVTFTGTKSGITLLIFALEQKLKVHWNGLQRTFLLSYCTSKSEQAENSLVLPIRSRCQYFFNFKFKLEIIVFIDTHITILEIIPDTIFDVTLFMDVSNYWNLL